MTKFETARNQYLNAVQRLAEILNEEKNDINRDSAIKRFEFTFDLSWKAIKALLEEEKGIKCFSPKECFKEAFRQGILDYDELWLAIIDWRNQAVHMYSESFADGLYEKLPEAFKRFQALAERLKK